MNFNNFTIKSQEAIQKAIEITRGAGNQAIEPVHLLKGVMTEGESLINFIFSKVGANVATLMRQVDTKSPLNRKCQVANPTSVAAPTMSCRKLSTSPRNKVTNMSLSKPSS